MKEPHAERRARLRPVLEALRAAPGAVLFLDLCELLLMLAEDIDGSIDWDHPRVKVTIRGRVAAARIAQKRDVELEVMQAPRPVTGSAKRRSPRR